MKPKKRPPCKPTGRSYGSVDTLVRYTMPENVRRTYKKLQDAEEATAKARVLKRFPKAFARKIYGLWHILSGYRRDRILATGRSEKSAWNTASIFYNCN